MSSTVEERRLRMLHSKKEQMFRSFQKLYDLCGNLGDVQSRLKFLGLVVSLDKTKAEFADLIDEIMLLEMELDEEYIPNHDVLDTVDEMCHAIWRAEQALRSEETERLSGGAGRTGNEAAVAWGSFRPSKFELPYFSGDICEWETFYEQFLSLVHENPNLSNIDKSYCLMRSLKGPARDICAVLSLSGDNYEEVWDSLVERYHDTRTLAKGYLNQILEWRDFREESEKGLISFLEKFDSSVRALRKLKFRDLADFIFSHHALARLNPETANYFEMNRDSGSVPQYDELLEFIKLRVKTLATSKIKDSVKSKESKHSKVKAFMNLSPENRYLKIKRLNLCYNCFAEDHKVRSCPSPSKCDKCNLKHHKLIHRDPARMKPADPSSERKTDEGVNLCSTGLSGTTKEMPVLLGTAEVEIQGPLGRCKGRFLIDSGSQSNVICRRFGRKLGVSITKCSSSVQGLGGLKQPVRGLAKFTVVTKDKNSTPFAATALVVKKITGLLPQVPVQLRNDSWLRRVPLADRNFDRPGQIDGLLGAEFFATILGSNHVKGNGRGLIAMDTSLGHIVIGRIQASRTPGEQQGLLSRNEAHFVEDLGRRLSEIETVPKIERNSSEEEECEKMFRKDSFGDSTGMSLPFKIEPSQLGDSRALAWSRYFSLEVRLRKNSELMEGYRRAMEDFIEQGHIYPVREDFSNAPSYYIPHHAVYKVDSESTPVRIVLDASVPTLEEAERLFREFVELVRKGKFELTKWVSNSQEFLDGVPLDRRSKCKMIVNFEEFLSRKGPCRVLYSDRGTNFIGARGVLTELEKLTLSEKYHQTIGRELSDRQVEWKFCPAAWCSSQVKVVKRHLFRVIGEQVLSYEELNTLLVQVGALLNSRPLCRLSSDPSAPSALTPAHFLHSAPLDNLPMEDLLEVKQNRHTRFQLLDQLVQSFWKRWKLEYLTSLQDRQKWSKKSDNIEIGMVVLLRMENSRPLQWPLAVVTAVFPGRDGVVQTVELRCGGKSLIRPVVKVCPLPTQ